MPLTVRLCPGSAVCKQSTDALKSLWELMGGARNKVRQGLSSKTLSRLSLRHHTASSVAARAAVEVPGVTPAAGTLTLGLGQA